MKQLLFLVIYCSCLLLSETKAQGRNTETGTTVNVENYVNQFRKTNGSALVHTRANGFKLYATYKDGKAVDYYGVDNNGNQIPPVYTASKTKCMACMETTRPDGLKETFCYEVNCKNLPPMPKGPVKVRN